MDISVVFAQMVQYGVATEHLYKFVGERQNYVQRQSVRFFSYLYLQYSKLTKKKHKMIVH